MDERKMKEKAELEKERIQKIRTRYRCGKCGVKYPNEVSSCPDCGTHISDVRKGFPSGIP